MIEQTVVEAPYLSRWINDCHERGGEVKFVVPSRMQDDPHSNIHHTVVTYMVLWVPKQ